MKLLIVHDCYGEDTVFAQVIHDLKCWIWEHSTQTASPNAKVDRPLSEPFDRILAMKTITEQDNGNNSQPLVSIITVVLNRPDELQRTIKSVSSQTYNNIEYLIIDGGSDEATISIIESNSNHISYSVSEEDEGIYDAINKGIMASSGEYISILHAGDLFDTDFIERSVAELRKPDVDPLRTVTYANYRHGDKEVEAGPVTNGIYLHHFGINHQTFLVPRALYDAIGVYNPNFKVVSDAVWIRQAVDFGCRAID